MAPRLKRPLFGSSHDGGPSHGRDVRDFVKRTLNRLPAQLPVGADFFPRPPGGFDDIYNAKTEEAMEVVRRYNEHRPFVGPFRQSDLDDLWQYADAYSKWVYRIYRPPKPPVPIPTMVFPLPLGAGGVVCQGLHPTAGLVGNWAIDFCAPPNTPVLSPEGGVIQKLSGHSPSEDTWDTMGVFGWTVYVRTDQGYVYFITHLGWRPAFVVGQRVQAGEIVGKVGDQHYRPDHVHVGVTSPLGVSDAKARITAVSKSTRVKPAA